MDWQALTYAGHTVWNMHAARDGNQEGEKRRPREEWIVTRDTHEALITDAEAEAILAQMERARSGRRLRESPLLLSGLLRTPTGTGWHSDGCGYYRAGKGRKVGAQRLEAAVLEHIGADLQSETAVSGILDAMHELMDEPGSPRELASLEKRIATLTTKIGRTVDLAGGLDDPAPVLRRVADLEHARAQLVQQADGLRRRLSSRAQASTITPDQVRAMLRIQMQEIAQADDQQAMRRALSDIVSTVVIDPDTLSGWVEYAVATGDKVASRSRSEESPAGVVALRGTDFAIERFRRRHAA